VHFVLVSPTSPFAMASQPHYTLNTGASIPSIGLSAHSTTTLTYETLIGTILCDSIRDLFGDLCWANERRESRGEAMGHHSSSGCLVSSWDLVSDVRALTDRCQAGYLHFDTAFTYGENMHFVSHPPGSHCTPRYRMGCPRGYPRDGHPAREALLDHKARVRTSTHAQLLRGFIQNSDAGLAV